MKTIINFIVIIAIMQSMYFTAFAGDIPEALNYEDNAKIFVGTLKDFIIDNSSGSVVKNVQVLPTYKIKGDVEIDVLQTYDMCYFEKVIPEKDAEYLFGWLGDNSIWVYAIESYNDNEIKLKLTDEFAERIQRHLNDGLYERGEAKRIETPLAYEKIRNAKVLADLFGLDRKDIEQIEVIYPLEKHPAGCYVDKEKFFELAEKISLIPKNRIDELDDNYAVWIVAVSKNDNRYSIRLDSKGRIGLPEYETSSAITSQYDINNADYIKLHALLPDEATAHIPLENPMKKYVVVIIGAAVFVFAIAFLIGFVIKMNRR